MENNTHNATKRNRFSNIELEVEGRLFNIRFSDADMRFEIIELKKKKHWNYWWNKKMVEYQQPFYEGSGALFRAMAKEVIYTINIAKRDKRDQLDKEITGDESFKYILDVVEKELDKNEPKSITKRLLHEQTN